MGLFSNPLGYAGYPPGVTGTAQNLNTTVRAATATEAAAGTRTDVYISPATEASSVTLDFASPPPMGSTTPNTGKFTTLEVTTGPVTLDDGAEVRLGTTTGNQIGTTAAQKLAFFGATPIVQEVATTDLRQLLIDFGFLATGGASPLNLNGGSLTALQTTVTAPTTGPGASPVVNDAKAGIAGFTDIIANGAYGTLTITSAAITGASTVILFTASCTTANSALQVVDYVPGAGTVAVRLYNAGSASTATTINLSYSILN